MIRIDKTLLFIVIVVLLFLSGMAAIIFASQHKLLEKALYSNTQLKQDIVVLEWALDDCEKKVSNE